MTASKNAFLAVVFLLIAVIFSSIDTEQVSPVPVEVTQPEQSHYAVFYVICDVLQHILITGDPPLRHSMAMRPSQKLLDLLKATPIERIIELNYAGPECFYSEQPAPEKPIL